MPSIVRQARQVQGQRPPVISRPAEDDEHYVMWRYAGHATRCSQCQHPLETLRKGVSLCKRGVLHARSITQYLESRNGKIFSLVDRDIDRHLQVQLPEECEVIRELMLAVERGLLADSQKSAQKAEILGRINNTELRRYSDKDSRNGQQLVLVRSKKRPSEVSHYSKRGSLFADDVGYLGAEQQVLSEEDQFGGPQRRVTWAS